MLPGRIVDLVQVFHLVARVLYILYDDVSHLIYLLFNTYTR